MCALMRFAISSKPQRLIFEFRLLKGDTGMVESRPDYRRGSHSRLLEVGMDTEEHEAVLPVQYVPMKSLLQNHTKILEQPL